MILQRVDRDIDEGFAHGFEDGYRGSELHMLGFQYWVVDQPRRRLEKLLEIVFTEIHGICLGVGRNGVVARLKKKMP